MSAFGLISVVSRHATDIIPVILQVNLSTLWPPRAVTLCTANLKTFAPKRGRCTALRGNPEHHVTITDRKSTVHSKRRHNKKYAHFVIRFGGHRTLRLGFQIVPSLKRISNAALAFNRFIKSLYHSKAVRQMYDALYHK